MARSTERKNTRMKQWDYSSEGCYFVTICVKNRAHVFGVVDNGKMILNERGKFAYECWEQIPIHFPDVEIEQFVVMPNHVHGIVVLKNKTEHVVRNKYIYSLSTNGIKKSKNRNMMKLSKIIATYKAAVTRKINKNPSNNYFAWQRSFHDHIIRGEREFHNIQNYIFFNPDNWRDDDFFVQSS